MSPQSEHNQQQISITIMLKARTHYESELLVFILTAVVAIYSWKSIGDMSYIVLICAVFSLLIRKQYQKASVISHE